MLLELNLFSVIHFDIFFALIAVCLNPDAILFNDDFSLKGLSAVGCVHLCVQSDHDECVCGALCPVDDGFSLRELAVCLTLLHLEH